MKTITLDTLLVQRRDDRIVPELRDEAKMNNRPSRQDHLGSL